VEHELLTLTDHLSEGKTIQWLKVKWTTTKEKEKKRKKDKQCLHKTITQKSKD
jgi:hypothetical protein